MGAVCGKGDNNTENNGSSSEKQPLAKAKVQKDDVGTKFLVGLLNGIPLLSELKKGELTQLATCLVEKNFDKGSDLMKQGETGDEFFIVTQGGCDVFVTADGKTTRVAQLGNGDYCGEQALISEVKRTATITASEETSCLVLDRENFNRILKNSKVMFAKRNNKRIAIATENLENFAIDESKDTAKTEQETLWVLDCIHDNLLFENLSPDQQRVIVKHMYKEECKAGTKLIEQGTEGNTFYVVIEGEFDIHVDGVGKVDSLTKGGCTGDLALMYNAPRSATVQATSDAVLWVTERQTFRKALMDHNKNQTHQNIEFLKQVPLLAPLTAGERALVDQALEEMAFKKDEVIFHQGDKGDKFYVLLKGSVEIVKKGADGEVEETIPLEKPGNFFGERALLSGEPRAASVTCTDAETICLVLGHGDFKTLLGPLEDIMNRNLEEYEKPAEERNLIGVSKDDEDDICELENMRTIGILGKGAFGTVSLVVDPNTKKSYALKAIRKIQVVELGQQSHIVNEKKVMKIMKSPFLVNLRQTYKDQWRVYLLLDVCLGGELFTILRKMRSFDEPTARFFTACVIEAFDYMHGLNIIYRDLKPENLVMDSNGYLKVTDFGFAKVVVNKTFTLCGTPDYLAPEIVTGQGHGKGVDWWTLGVLIYEMISSFPPFFDDEPMMTYRKIISCKYKFPKYLSPESKDIISRLLKVRPTKRLGVIKGGAKLLRDHAWFQGFRWQTLQDQSMKAPIKPEVKAQDDISNFDQFEPEKEQLEFDLAKVDMSWDEAF